MSEEELSDEEIDRMTDEAAEIIRSIPGWKPPTAEQVAPLLGSIGKIGKIKYGAPSE